MIRMTAIGLLAASSLAAGVAAASPADAPRMESQVAAPLADGAEEELTLRINDAIVRPGGVAAAVIRTYRSRGVGSGQVCFAVRQQVLSADVSAPTVTYLGAEVFNPEDDVITRIQREPDELTLRFLARPPTINSVDGPLAVIYFRVTGVLPDQEFEMSTMLDSFLIGADGAPIPLDLREGRLKVAEPGERFEIGAGAEDVIPGDVALLSIQTKELRLLASGTLALRFDPSIAAGAPTVRMDERRGTVTFDASASNPAQGLMVVNFESSNRDYNRVPGDIFEVMLPTRADIAPGTTSLVRPDQALTVVVDAAGRVLPLAFENERLQFIAAP
jgi:hypothetical protein